MRNPYLPFANDEWEKLENSWALVLDVMDHPSEPHLDLIRLDVSMTGVQYTRRTFFRHELLIEE